MPGNFILGREDTTYKRQAFQDEIEAHKATELLVSIKID